MAKSNQTPQQDVTNPQKDPAVQSPLVTSPLTQPVLSMQNFALVAGKM